jgi:predicted ATPase with chaperone activity
MIIIVGLPDAAVKESRDRVKTAQTNSGFNRLPHASGC